MVVLFSVTTHARLAETFIRLDQYSIKDVKAGLVSKECTDDGRGYYYASYVVAVRVEIGAENIDIKFPFKTGTYEAASCDAAQKLPRNAAQPLFRELKQISLGDTHLMGGDGQKTSCAKKVLDVTVDENNTVVSQDFIYLPTACPQN